MAIKLDMMRCFRAVAEGASLAAAAERLHRTPSAISMVLSALEAEIGAPLFETERKNKLTPLGQRVLEESQRATDSFTRSAEAIARHALSIAGTVRLVAVPSATVTLLPEAIARFRAKRPEVRLEISDDDSAGVQMRLQRDEADIGILSSSGPLMGVGDVVLQDRLGIVCRATGPIAQAGGASWEALALEPLITNPLCALVDHPKVRALVLASTLSARNTSALLSFIRAGLGATVLPSSTIPPGANDLRFIAAEAPTVSRSLIRLRSPGRRLSPAAQAFWEELGG